MQLRLLLPLLALLLNHPTLAQEGPCLLSLPRDTLQWGIGVVWIEPENSIPLYDTDTKKAVGKLETQRDYPSRSLILEADSFRVEYGRDVIPAGHVVYTFLKVYDSIPGYYLVFIERDSKGLLVKKTDLVSPDLQFLTYQDLLFRSKGNISRELKHGLDHSVIGVNLVNSCLYLRENPSKNARKIRCALPNDRRTNLTTHLVILETKGYWAKVKLSRYSWTNCPDAFGECDMCLKTEEIGWVKAIDDKTGVPNIWYNISAY